MLVQVLQEAQEDRVHRHAVDGEEAGGDGIGGQDDHHHGDEPVVELHLEGTRVGVGEGGEGDEANDADNDHFSYEENEVSDLVQRSRPNKVLGQQNKAFASGLAEVVAVDSSHDVGVPVHVPDELLEAPHAALAAAHDTLDSIVVLQLVLLQLLLHVLEQDPDHAHDGKDQRAKGKGAKVEAASPVKTRQEPSVGDLARLVPGPVPAREGASHHHLLHRLDEEQQPEESKEVQKLKQGEYKYYMNLHQPEARSRIASVRICKRDTGRCPGRWWSWQRW